jgi:hypothetical protein
MNGRVFRGSCHCGNIAVAFETEMNPQTIPLREDSCSFCRRHAALTTSDPKGSVVLQVRQPSLLSRYQFGLRVAEMWVCACCGVYVGAIMRDEGDAFATINIRCLEDAALFTSAPSVVDYGSEDAAARRERRRRAWTPVRGTLP